MIKKSFFRTFLLLTVSFLFYAAKGQTILSTPKQVIITGKVNHYSPDIPVMIYVNRLGFSTQHVTAKTDSLGNFYATFESYIPTDAWITYKSNFLVLTYPGDSLHVEFDGQPDYRPDVLRTVKYSGSTAESNRYASVFQQLFFSDPLYTDFNKKNQAIKDYEVGKYTLYLNALKSHSDNLYKMFVSQYHPDERSKKWALLYVEQEYYDRLAFYPKDHREANNMSIFNGWDVPKGYFQKLANRLPLDSTMLVCGYSLLNFSDRFNKYVADQTKGNLPEGGAVNAGGWFLPANIGDSIIIHSIIKYVPDTLLRQIMLTDYFSRKLEKQQITEYGRFKQLREEYIKLPFLKEPLDQLYQQTKMRIDNPNLYTKTVLKEAAGSSVAQLLDSILKDNKNKVIYIDVWATWCGPCLSEFPNSKLVEQQMKDRNAAFIYLCTASQKDQWKATLAKFKLGGQHYFLTTQQSRELTRTFEIKGIPFYILIDKNGVIREKGNQLRPLDAKNKMEKLL